LKDDAVAKFGAARGVVDFELSKSQDAFNAQYGK
jgi:hypothetical protein